jgi:hypothetical protein
MKSYLTFLCLSLLIVGAACHKKDSSGPSGTLEVNRTTINLDTAVGFTGTLIVHSNLPWTATVSSGSNWFQLNKTSGGTGDSVLTLTVLSNNGNATPRTATITFSAGSSEVPPVTVTVTQKLIGAAWQKCLGGSRSDAAFSIAKTADGGTILAGITSSSDGDVSSGNHDGGDILVVKLDAAGNKQWSKTFGGTGEDYAMGIVAAADGGYAVAGYTKSTDGDITNSHGLGDMVVIKLDASGNKQWVKTFGGTKYDIANSIATTIDGGFVLTGQTVSTDGDVSGNHGSFDLLAIKIDASGNIVWSKTIGGSLYDAGYSVVQTNDGGYAIAGFTSSKDGDISSNQGTTDFLVVKLNASGNKQWVKTYGGMAEDYAMSIIATADGGYALAGYTSSVNGDVTSNHGSSDLWVMKLDASGSKQWAKTFGGSDSETHGSIISSPDGGYVVATITGGNDGDVTGYHGGVSDIWVVKLNGSGSKVWAKTFGGSAYEEALGISSTIDGRVVVCGETESTDGDVSGNHGTTDMWMFNLDF